MVATGNLPRSVQGAFVSIYLSSERQAFVNGALAKVPTGWFTIGPASSDALAKPFRDEF